ncbi:MAG: hypothetical protein LBE08_08780, partial [Bifidobacteriaceae bacterium]|nr:hypothetical protein [Bifidobacteriaceae bacterium]
MVVGKHLRGVERQEHVHAAVLVRPAKQSRRDRAAQEKAMRLALSAGQARQRAQARLALEDAKRERALTEYLPAAGEPGPA